MPLKKSSIVFIFITIAIDAIGLGIVIPVLPDVVRKFVSGESNVSYLYGYFIAIYALMQFICSPFLGSLSDRFGRRPILLIALLGAAIDYCFMAYAPTLPLLFLGRIIAGISGASFTVASAYIADISNDENRSANFGVIGAGFGIGLVIGPAIGGWLATYGSEFPFLAAALFNLLNFFFGLFFVPESLPPEQRRPVTLQALNPFRALSHVFRLKQIRTLLWVYIIFCIGTQIHPSIWTLYTENRYGWTTAQVGLSLALVGVLSAFSQGFLTKIVVKKFGERKILAFGTIGEALSYLGFALAPNGITIMIVLAISSPFWTAHPTLQSLISREVPSNEQGELQGSLMSLMSVISIVTPIICTSLYASFGQTGATIYFPGAPYAFGSIVFLIGAVLVFKFNKETRPGASVLTS